MKPETRIALVKIAEKAKRIQTEEYSGRWVKQGYVGATLSSLAGLYFISLAIAAISRGVDPIIGALFLLVSLAFALAPWYFMIRYKFNLKIQLLSEAILSVNQDKSDVANQRLPSMKQQGRQGDGKSARQKVKHGG